MDPEHPAEGAKCLVQEVVIQPSTVPAVPTAGLPAVEAIVDRAQILQELAAGRPHRPKRGGQILGDSSGAELAGQELSDLQDRSHAVAWHLNSAGT